MSNVNNKAMRLRIANQKTKYKNNKLSYKKEHNKMLIPQLTPVMVNECDIFLEHFMTMDRYRTPGWLLYSVLFARTPR